MSDDKHPAFLGHCPEMLNNVLGPATAFKQELFDFSARNQVLANDLARCNKFYIKKPKDQFWRRAIIKNIFTVMESTIYGLKQIAIHRHRDTQTDFSNAEVATLLEEKYMLNKDGEVDTHGKNFQKFIPNLKFTFKTFAKAHGMTHQWDNAAGPLLKDFETVRNRITHPKKLVELDITDSEINNANKLWQWFSCQLLHLVSAGLKSRLDPRIPPPPPTYLGATKDHVVILPNGNVFQFDTLKEAQSFAKPFKLKKKSIGLNPIFLETKNLKKK